MIQKIIDFHTHIYPTAIAAKAVASIEDFYEIRTGNKDGTEDALEQISKRAGAVRVVVCSVATHPKQVDSINSYLAQAAARNPRFIPFCTLHPDMSEAAIKAEYARIKELGMKGVKLHPDFQRFAADGKEAEKLLGCLDGALPVLIHSGDKRYRLSNPDRIINAAKRFPYIKLVAAHFGGYSQWEYAENYKDIANAYFDTSSSLAFLSSQRARQIICDLGADRFLFGSDYPMWSAVDELERLQKLELDDDSLDKILYYNAARLLGLSDE